jgi:hypothetical protein
MVAPGHLEFDSTVKLLLNKLTHLFSPIVVSRFEPLTGAEAMLMPRERGDLDDADLCVRNQRHQPPPATIRQLNSRALVSLFVCPCELAIFLIQSRLSSSLSKSTRHIRWNSRAWVSPFFATVKWLYY